jgi:RNA polymerase-binding transcription factor DksA
VLGRRTLCDVDAEAARRQLEAEHQRLEHLRASLDNDHLHDEPEEDSSGELSHLDQHPADNASDTFEREKAFALLDRIQTELDDVERSLKLLDEGTYGQCQACGTEIGDERLAALPAARFCMEHQTQVEA